MFDKMNAPMKSSDFLKYLYGPEVKGSHERPAAFLKWSRTLSDDQGNEFWAALTDAWRLFDNIQYDDFSKEMVRFRSTAPGYTRDVTAWRGQCMTKRNGLCWSLDQSVAISFADGIGGRNHIMPAIFEMEIKKEQIAFFTDERSENEIVLFESPSDDDITIIDIE